jgi:hypothetical protein
VQSQHFTGKNEENHENLIRIRGFPADIRTEHLLNTILERYRYVKLLRESAIQSGQRVTVTLSLYLIMQQALKAQLHVFTGTGCRWAVSFTRRLFYRRR